jgi:hypothetical protein
MRLSRMDSGRNEEMTTMMTMINTRLRLEEDEADDQAEAVLWLRIRLMTKLRLS